MLNPNSGSRTNFMMPTAKNYPPVSVGELPSHDYRAVPETITETVSAHLETHPEIPGVIIVNAGEIHSVIPRSKMFERLGHRFGVELFIRRAIAELQENIQTELCMVSSSTRINAAANTALSRNISHIYDPLVIKYEDGSFRLLDMHVLLMAQALVSENMHNIISNINRIEQSIKADIPLDASLDMIVDAIKRTTPHHRIVVLIKSDQWIKTASYHEIFQELSLPLNDQFLIKSILNSRQYIHIENTSATPSWAGMEFIGKTSVWLGVPIASGKNVDGILSLSRITNTPFNKNEIDMALTFAEFLSIAINKSSDNHEENLYNSIIKRRFTL